MVIVCAFSKRVREMGVEITFWVVYSLFFLKANEQNPSLFNASGAFLRAKATGLKYFSLTFLGGKNISHPTLKSVVPNKQDPSVFRLMGPKFEPASPSAPPPHKLHLMQGASFKQGRVSTSCQPETKGCLDRG